MSAKSHIRYASERKLFEEAIRYNPSMKSSSAKDPNREKFFENLDKMPFDKLVKKYTYTPSIIKRIYWKVKRIAKSRLKGIALMKVLKKHIKKQRKSFFVRLEGIRENTQKNR